jgi:hypothetical protein
MTSSPASHANKGQARLQWVFTPKIKRKFIRILVLNSANRTPKIQTKTRSGFFKKLSSDTFKH